VSTGRFARRSSCQSHDCANRNACSHDGSHSENDGPHASLFAGSSRNSCRLRCGGSADERSFSHGSSHGPFRFLFLQLNGRLRGLWGRFALILLVLILRGGRGLHRSRAVRKRGSRFRRLRGLAALPESHCRQSKHQHAANRAQPRRLDSSHRRPL